MKNDPIMVALSGGVDSAVAAALLDLHETILERSGSRFEEVDQQVHRLAIPSHTELCACDQFDSGSSGGGPGPGNSVQVVMVGQRDCRQGSLLGGCDYRLRSLRAVREAGVEMEVDRH